MSVPKIKGIETELSIVLKRGNDYEPAEIKYLREMINAVRRYFFLPEDSSGESLGEMENIDRIGDIDLTNEESLPRLFPRSSHHNLLPNGARFYIDVPHLEYSTAECLSAKTLVAADRAGEVLVNLARKIINDGLAGTGRELIVRKDNCDRNGDSYGCHENYLVSRDIFNEIVSPGSLTAGYLASFLVCRLVFTGSGKMGVEFNGRRLEECEAIYQISQRADFMQEPIGSCTIVNRAIINTRDEPLADPKRFGRLHLILGDANLSEIANYMKVGITSIILKMLEDGFLNGDIIIMNPVKDMALVSQDLTCKSPVLKTLGGRKLSSLDLNEEFFQRAKAYFSGACEPSAEEKDLLSKWEETISDFRDGNEARLQRRFDWKLKWGIFDYFLQIHGVPWESIGRARVKEGGRSYRVVDELCKKDLLYHDLDKERGLYWAYKGDGDVEELVSREEVVDLVKNPPPECRSYFRGKCIGKFFKDIQRINWDSICFGGNRKKGRKDFFIHFSPLEVEMANPAWGSRDDTGEILGRAATSEDLLKELQGLEQES